MDYNTTREPMIIPEYGRNVKKLIDYALTIEDREKRSKIAKLIVNVMGQVSNQPRDGSDFRQKLWDHLIIISDFKLDIDSPYPKPSPKVLYTKPEKVSYSNKKIHYRYYGRNIELIIEKAATLNDGPEKEALIKAIANHLKKSYLTWNRESVDDEVIAEHISSLSNEKLKLSKETKLNNTHDILSRSKKKTPDYKRSNNRPFNNTKKKETN